MTTYNNSLAGTGGSTISLGGESTLYIPNSYNSTYSGFEKNITWTKSAFFKTLLQGDNFSHKQGQIEKNDFDRIENFITTNESKMIEKSVFYKGQQYYLTYYSKDSKSFIFMKF